MRGRCRYIGPDSKGRKHRKKEERGRMTEERRRTKATRKTQRDHQRGLWPIPRAGKRRRRRRSFLSLSLSPPFPLRLGRIVPAVVVSRLSRRRRKRGRRGDGDPEATPRNGSPAWSLPLPPSRRTLGHIVRKFVHRDDVVTRRGC